jgi:coenzyme F420-dependent oxidoreductase
MDSKGLRLPLPSEQGRATCIEFAELADERGIDTVWVPETWARNSVVLMTQLAERLEHATLASGITNIYSRTPGLVAMTAAALVDVGGGFRLGLGASGPAVVENFHGQSFERPLRRTREYIEIVNALLDGEEIEYDGDIFELSGFSLEDPVDADVPIYVAAMGENNLRLTGEFADGWLPLFVPIHEMADAIDTIAEGATRRDRTLDDVDVSPFIVTCISDTDPEDARDRVRGMLAFYVGAMGDFYYRTVSRFGYEDEADAIRSAWTDGETDAARAAVTDEMLDSFAIAGSPDQAAERLAAYEDVGVDSAVAYVPTTAPPDLIRDTIDAFADL